MVVLEIVLKTSDSLGFNQQIKSTSPLLTLARIGTQSASFRLTLNQIPLRPPAFQCCNEAVMGSEVIRIMKLIARDQRSTNEHSSFWAKSVSADSNALSTVMPLNRSENPLKQSLGVSIGRLNLANQFSGDLSNGTGISLVGGTLSLLEDIARSGARSWAQIEALDRLLLVA